MAGLKTTDADARLGERIKSFRVALGFTQRQTADVIGVSAAQLQKYERGVNAISAVSLIKVSQLFGRPITDFLDPPVAEAVQGADAQHGHALCEALEAKLCTFIRSPEVRALFAEAA